MPLLFLDIDVQIYLTKLSTMQALWGRRIGFFCFLPIADDLDINVSTVYLSLRGDGEAWNREWDILEMWLYHPMSVSHESCL